MRTVYLGTSDFAVQVLRRVADSPHKPDSGGDPSGSSARPWSQADEPAGSRRGPADRHSGHPAPERQRRGVARADRRREARRGADLRVRRAHQRAAPERLPDAQRAPVAAPALARRRPDRALHPGRRHHDRRDDHAPDRGDGCRADLPAGDDRDQARRRLRLAVPPPGRPRRRTARQGPGRASRLPSAAGRGHHARRQDRPRGPLARLRDECRAPLAAGPRAEPARRHLDRDGRRRAPRRPPRAARPGRGRPGARRRTRRTRRQAALRHYRRRPGAARGPARRRPRHARRGLAARAGPAHRRDG